MTLPLAGKGMSMKQPALSLTQSSEPTLQIKLDSLAGGKKEARPEEDSGRRR
jgi:hypothetical protein